MEDERPAGVGHNNPPSPIDEIAAQYEAERAEAEVRLDGEPVQNEAEMLEADKLRKAMRECRLALERGQKEATEPLRKALDEERSRWKPPIEDHRRIEKGLVAAVDAFKRQLAEQKRAEERAAWEAANAAKREAEEKARAAAESDLEAQREADAARAAAIEAEKAAQAARKGKPKGLRTVTHYQIADHRAALHDIAASDREAVTAFIEEYVRRNHKRRAIAGVRTWTEKEAF